MSQAIFRLANPHTTYIHKCCVDVCSDTQYNATCDTRTDMRVRCSAALFSVRRVRERSALPHTLHRALRRPSVDENERDALAHFVSQGVAPFSS